MTIENILNQSNKNAPNMSKLGKASIATAVALGLAACGTTTTPYQGGQPVERGIPVQIVEAYSPRPSRENVLPRFPLDQGGSYFVPQPDRIDDINWMSENRLVARGSAQCPRNYSLVTDQVLRLEDGSFCYVDLCSPTPQVVHRDGGGEDRGTPGTDAPGVGGRGAGHGGGRGQTTE